jgi:uncharacterized protein YutD
MKENNRSEYAKLYMKRLVTWISDQSDSYGCVFYVVVHLRVKEEEEKAKK